MNLYHDQFSVNHDFPLADNPSKILVIASTARCGSHMLGHSLYKTGQFGFPLEYANPTNLAEWKKRFGTNDIFDCLREIQRRRISPNGVFGIKIHYSHIGQFGGFDNVKSVFPDAYYVFLNRRDVLRQAISSSIASQTGVWIDGQEPTNNNPKYDYHDINCRLRNIMRDTSSWRYILTASNCNFIEIEFEFAKRDISKAIKRIARFMGFDLDPRVTLDQPATVKQSTNMNDDWRRRFLADYNGEALFERDRIGIMKMLRSRIKKILGGQ